jgi:hypothetical protein
MEALNRAAAARRLRMAEESARRSSSVIRANIHEGFM